MIFSIYICTLRAVPLHGAPLGYVHKFLITPHSLFCYRDILKRRVNRYFSYSGFFCSRKDIRMNHRLTFYGMKSWMEQFILKRHRLSIFVCCSVSRHRQDDYLVYGERPRFITRVELSSLSLMVIHVITNLLIHVSHHNNNTLFKLFFRGLVF